MSKRLALLVVSAAIPFDALDLSITQVALPSIQADLMSRRPRCSGCRTRTS